MNKLILIVSLAILTPCGKITTQQTSDSTTFREEIMGDDPKSWYKITALCKNRDIW